MSSAITLRAETDADRAAGDALVAAAFGPGRLAKTAERLREHRADAPVVALVAENEGDLLGVVRLWPVKIGETPALFLGPIAVAASARSQGLGRTLIEAACEAARKDGWRLVLLVGDAAWFSPSGFSAEHTGAVELPGPVDPRRVLLKPLAPGAGEGLAGAVKPA